MDVLSKLTGPLRVEQNVGLESPGTPAYGLDQLGGGIYLRTIGKPDPPTVTPHGTPGSTTYDYRVIAYDRGGFPTRYSVAGSTSSGAATLTGTNFNRVTWTAVPGAASYAVLRNSVTASIGTTAGTTLDDTGQATTTIPQVNADSTGTLMSGAGWAMAVPAFDDGSGNTVPFGTDVVGSQIIFQITPFDNDGQGEPGYNTGTSPFGGIYLQSSAAAGAPNPVWTFAAQVADSSVPSGVPIYQLVGYTLQGDGSLPDSALLWDVENNWGGTLVGLYADGRLVMTVPTTAIADGQLAIGQASLYLNEGTSPPHLEARVRDSGGTYSTLDLTLRDHTLLTNIGTNSHAAIDTHIAATAAHGATGAVVGTTNTQTLTNKTLTQPVIGDFTNAHHDHSNSAGGAQLAHGNLTSIGTNSHATLDSHLAAASGVHGVTGSVVGTTDSQTLTNKTLTTPTIGSFTNAQHDHSNAAGGGTLGLAALPSTPTALATLSGDFTHNSDGNWLVVPWDTEAFDTDTEHDNVTNNTRLTAKTAGKYYVFGILNWASNATGNRGAWLYVNGVSDVFSLVNNNGAAILVGVPIFKEYNLAANDYVELYAFQNSGGNLAVKSTSYFGMVRVGA